MLFSDFSHGITHRNIIFIDLHSALGSLYGYNEIIRLKYGVKELMTEYDGRIKIRGKGKLNIL